MVAGKRSQPIHEKDPQRAGIVLGLVAAVGSDVDAFEALLQRLLDEFSYKASIIRITDLLRRFTIGGKRLPTAPEGRRLSAFMDLGNKIRKQAGSGEILALYAAAEIKRLRGDKDDSQTVYVIRTLKHPEEVNALRRIYGHGFFLIGLYTDEKTRQDNLIQRKDVAKSDARDLVKRDQEEADEFGQQTRKTFALADAFIRFGSGAEENALGRVLDLFFGNPCLTPTADEYSMFLAYSAALRSGDLSRQVGAVVVNARGDVIASGANDVPRADGGLYWPGSDDRRDYVLGFDSNERMRNRAIIEIMRGFGRKGSKPELLAQGKTRLKSTMLMDITEFGRAVHAEMEALLSCARNGSSPIQGTLYTTTFPCHNCAKHIVSAGIKRVVFVEPYPKSKVRELYKDSIAIENSDGTKVLFEPFIGLGPRRFIDLYSMQLGTGYRLIRKIGERAIAWDRASAQPRVPMLPSSYRDREALATNKLRQRIGGA